MYFKSKKVTLIILAITAMLCSRAMFVFIDDPEGPNLLVVTVLASIIYFLSLSSYLLALKHTPRERLFLTVFLQIVITICGFILLK
jgi:hypothetical protein